MIDCTQKCEFPIRRSLHPIVEASHKIARECESQAGPLSNILHSASQPVLGTKVPELVFLVFLFFLFFSFSNFRFYLLLFFVVLFFLFPFLFFFVKLILFLKM